MNLSTLILVVIGGGVGSAIRYFIANLGQSFTVSDFPLGTLLVNVLGCALIGLVTPILIGPLAHAQYREPLRLLLIVGLLGGFTTFSSFALDTIELVDSGRSGQAALYVILSNSVGLFAAWGSYRVGSFFFDAPPM